MIFITLVLYALAQSFLIIEVQNSKYDETFDDSVVKYNEMFGKYFNGQ